jgi:predicted anti-sigma-YlaC factor YlaD
MSCFNAENIYRYLDGELDQAERRDFERHVDACPKCRRAVEERRLLTEAAGSLPALELPADFSARVMARLERPRVTVFGWLAISAGSFASVVMLVVGVLTIGARSITDLVLGTESFLTSTLKNGAVLFGRATSLINLCFRVIYHFLAALWDGLAGVTAIIPLPWIAAITVVLLAVVTTSYLTMRKLFLGERS